MSRDRAERRRQERARRSQERTRRPAEVSPKPPKPEALKFRLSLSPGVVLFFLLAVAAAALVQSWAKWLDPIIDIGRDLYIPGALLEGKKLYRDILYEFPPLTPYLLAGLNLIVGRSLFAYTLIGISISAVVASQLWRIGRDLEAWEVGAVAAFLFLSRSFTGASTWGCNFIFPYAHAATMGMTFVLLFVALLVRAVIRNDFSIRSLALPLLFALLAAWTKIEFALLVAVTSAVVLLRHRVRLRIIVAALVAAAVSVGGVELIFRDAPVGQHWLFDQVLAPSLVQKSTGHRFYAIVSGTAHLATNISEIARSVVVIAFLLFVLVVLDRRSGSGRRRVVVECLFVLAAAFGVIWGVEEALFRSWAVFQFVLLPFAWRDRRSPLFIPLMVSILSTWRILLRLSPEWYGFFLAVPVYLVMPYVLIRYLPKRQLYSRRAGLVWIPVLLLVGFHGLYQQRKAHALTRFPIDTPRGMFFDSISDRATTLSRAIDSLSRSRQQTLVVMPEGLTLNYFTGMENPTPFYTFRPVGVEALKSAEFDAAAEARAIAALNKNPPEMVVLLSRDVREYGFRGFGVDYGRDLVSWVRTRYEPVRSWRFRRFGLNLFRRRPTTQDRRSPG